MNADRSLVLEFLQSGAAPLAMRSNPLAAQLAGVIVELDARSGTCTLEFTPPPSFVQGAQVIQGGAVATMLDFAMAFAVHGTLTHERSFSTATLSVQLLRPLAPARCAARGRVLRAGRRLVFAEAVLSDAGGAACATGNGVLAFLD